MPLKQAVTRVERQQYELSRRTTRELGATSADALRILIYAFNSHQGFPCEVHSLQPVDVEPSTNEAGTAKFAATLSLEIINTQR